MMLFSAILRLHALHPAIVPAAHGHKTHGAFLELVRRADPEAAAQLHDTNARKPFTTSPLRGFRVGREGDLLLRAGDEGWLRVTLAGDDYFRLFISHFTRWQSVAQLTIGAADLLVSAVLVTPGSHPWAGYTTPEDLMAQAAPDPHIRLELATPTAFSVGDGEIELSPRSDLVFDSLKRKWEKWCDAPLPAPWPERKWFWDNVVTAVDSLQRVRWRFENRVQLGMVGQFDYRIRPTDEATLRLLNGLADFAFYAGLGQKTTQGMGQVRRIARSSNSLIVEPAGDAHDHMTP